MLYPIIRRVRRPLLPPDEMPIPVAPAPNAPATVEESTAVVPVELKSPAAQTEARADVQVEPATVAPVVTGELALADVSVPAEPVTEKPNKPTPTKNGRKTKTEKE